MGNVFCMTGLPSIKLVHFKLVGHVTRQTARNIPSSNHPEIMQNQDECQLPHNNENARLIVYLAGGSV